MRILFYKLSVIAFAVIATQAYLASMNHQPHPQIDSRQTFQCQSWCLFVLALFFLAFAPPRLGAQTISNLVTNPGFETGLLTPWLGSAGLVSVSTVSPHTGSDCLAVSSQSSGHGTCFQTVSGLSPNTTYEVNAYCKIGTATAASLSVANYGGTEETTFLSTSYSGYQQIGIVFKTGASNTSAQILFGNNGLSGTCYADDFTLQLFVPPASDSGDTGTWTENTDFWDEFNGTALDTTKWSPLFSYWSGRAPSQFDASNVSESGGYLHLLMVNQNLLTNGEFETQDFTGWTQVGTGTFSITTLASGNASNYWYGASIGTPGTQLQQTITVTPNTTYRICADLKVASGGTSPQVTLGVVSPVITGTVTSTSWAYHTSVSFTTGASQTSATIYIANTSGTGAIYCDEVSVVPTTLPDGFHLSAGNYLTASDIQSKNTPVYGYYEARMKPSNACSSSSFWFQSQGAEEIDVAEEIGNTSVSQYSAVDDEMRMNTWYFLSNPAYDNPLDPSVGVAVASAFHTYGVDWEPNTITFYFDGQQVRQITESGSPPTANGQSLVTNLQYLFFDTEVFAGYGIPVGGSSSDFQVDYIRAWTHGEP
jgi:hypothetical protein